MKQVTSGHAELCAEPTSSSSSLSLAVCGADVPIVQCTSYCLCLLLPPSSSPPSGHCNRPPPSASRRADNLVAAWSPRVRTRLGLQGCVCRHQHIACRLPAPGPPTPQRTRAAPSAHLSPLCELQTLHQQGPNLSSSRAHEGHRHEGQLGWSHQI